MLEKMPFPGGKIRKLATANVILLANAFVWYLLAFNMLKEQAAGQAAPVSSEILIIGINTGAIVIAGLLGSFLFDKFTNRRRFLLLWIAIGILLSILPLGFNATTLSLQDTAIISLVFGLYFGLGMPATMGYHASVTKTEERATFGGFAFLIIGVISSIAGLIIFDNLIASCLILAFVRLLGLVVFLPQQKGAAPEEKERKVLSYRSIFSNKGFIIYFVPWCMFVLINYMTIPIQRSIFGTSENILSYNSIVAIEYAVTAVFAVISGFVADKIGRKRLSILGFVMLGIGYAILSVFSGSDLMFRSVLYAVSDGIAWGIFYVVFIFTLWGDLANGKNADKIYFLGALPFVSAYLIQLLFSPYIQANVDSATIFSFASVFLFIAVLPLIYAPETLPERIMKDRELKAYIEGAKKKVARDAEKAKKKAPQQKPAEKQSEEYEKAKALAEKYY